MRVNFFKVMEDVVKKFMETFARDDRGVGSGEGSDENLPIAFNIGKPLQLR